MNLDCPYCERCIDVTDHLPALACDDNEIECECGALLGIGWYAEAEVRFSKKPPEVNHD